VIHTASHGQDAHATFSSGGELQLDDVDSCTIGVSDWPQAARNMFSSPIMLP
jgi:hypothetical protein